MIMLISTIIIIVTIILIHSGLSTRTKQAGQTAKHASVSIHACVQYLSNRTKQAGQTVIAIAQYVLLCRKQAAETTLSPLLWQFAFDDGCSFSPFESLLSTSFGSIARSPNQIQTIGKPSSSLIQTDDCSSPSIIPTNYSTNYLLRLLGLSTDDCSHSPSTISQFQTKASVDLPLRSAATTTTETPIAAPSSTVADDLPTPSPLTVVVDIAGPPRRPTVASAAGPPRPPTAATSIDDLTSPSSPTASVDLPLRSTATPSRPTNLI
jgi:hypothetical protein